jgi:EpsI family protein
MVARASVVFVSLVVAAGAVARADRYDFPPVRQSFASFPLQVGSWRGVQEPPFDSRTLAVLRVDDYLTRAYSGPDRTGAGLYIGYWATQRQGSTIHSPLNCLPGAGWEPTSVSTVQLPDPRAPSRHIVVNRYLVQKGIERQLVMYWYQSHGRIVASDYWSRFYLVTDAVRFSRSDGAIVRITVPVSGDTAEAENQADRIAAQFASDLIPQLNPFLPL